MLQKIVLIVFSVVISLIDIKTYRIPDILSLGGLVIILGLSLYAGRMFFFYSLAASALAFSLFGMIHLTTKGQLGLGDAKLAAFQAAVLGIPPWFWSLLIASSLGLIFGLVFRKKWDKNRPIPFAPFLSAGVLMIVMKEVL